MERKEDRGDSLKTHVHAARTQRALEGHLSMSVWSIQEKRRKNFNSVVEERGKRKVEKRFRRWKAWLNRIKDGWVLLAQSWGPRSWASRPLCDP